MTSDQDMIVSGQSRDAWEELSAAATCGLPPEGSAHTRYEQRLRNAIDAILALRPSPSISEGEVEAALRETLVGGRIEILLDAMEGSPTRAFGHTPLVALQPEFAVEAAKAIRDLIGVTRSLAASKARATTEVEVKALLAVEKAAREMPRATPAPGAASTHHQFSIEAAVVWQLDAALTKLDAARSALVGGE